MNRPKCLHCEKQSIKGAPLCKQCLDAAMKRYENESYSFKTSMVVCAIALFIALISN